MNGSGELGAIDPIREAFFWTFARLRQISEEHPLDEESFTALMLGGVAFTAPLLSTFLSSTNDQKDVSWGMFKKNEKADSPFSESATGADFCLVVGQDDDMASVSIFQAKKITSENPRLLNVRRSGGKNAHGNTQLAMLTGFSCRLMAASGRADFQTFKDCSTTLEALDHLLGLEESAIERLIAEIDWVHHLIYHQHSATTLALRELDIETVKAELFKSSIKSHQLGDERISLEQVVVNALNGAGAGWLSMSRQVLTGLLPDLANVGTLVVSDRAGGRSLTPPNSDYVNLSVPPNVQPNATAQNREVWNSITAKPRRVASAPS